MAKKYVLEQISGLATYGVPANLSREIGRVIVHWSYFENCVQEMVWDILNLSAAAGRIAVRQPRVEDSLGMIHDLLELREGEWDDKLYKSILVRARLLAAKRHLIAHGKWHHYERGSAWRTDEWHVELARGSWPERFAEFVTGSKRVIPESVPMDMEALRSTTSEIQIVIEDLKKLRASARGGPLPSSEKRP
jgi:hypothetical protein